MAFYLFYQNNSFGRFEESEEGGISIYVIIEAGNAQDADGRAESIGIYFDGCESGIDCPCCGDRWHPADDSDGQAQPKVYDRLVTGPRDEKLTRWTGGPEVYVHYADGQMVPYWSDCPRM